MTASEALTLQLRAGLLNLWVWPAVVWAFGTGVLGAIEPWTGTVGWCGCLLFPFGFLEVFLSLGARGADDPGRASRRLARLQLAALFLGGVPSFLVGWRVLRTTDVL